MHHLCSNKSVTVPLIEATATLMKGIEGGAEAIFTKNEDSETPIHLLCNNNVLSHTTILQILIAFARISKKQHKHYDDNNKVKTLIKQSIFERAPASFDLFSALKMGLVWEFGIEDLIERNPDTLNVPDVSTGLYPFMVATMFCDLDTVYRLLMTCPDAVGTKNAKESLVIDEGGK